MRLEIRMDDVTFYWGNVKRETEMEERQARWSVS